jgi:pyridoxal phosphate enzyme (YggS family)
VRADRDNRAVRLELVQRSIADAANLAGRNPADITTIVVTKFQPSALVRELAACGVRNFGESRHQEARAKAHELADLDLKWHFVGQLQTKKARQVRSYAHVIHSVDRPSLVAALDENQEGTGSRSIDCFVQLNLTSDAGRGGVQPARLESLVEAVVSSRSLQLLGVMAVAPIDTNPRAAFEQLRRESERIRKIAPEATAISAGMSNDYRDAVLEGATHLRIGTAITGSRPEAA